MFVITRGPIGQVGSILNNIMPAQLFRADTINITWDYNLEEGDMRFRTCACSILCRT